MLLWSQLLLLLLLSPLAILSDEYQYKDYSLHDLKGEAAAGGTRLVNAKAVDGGNEFPFVAAYFIFGKAEMSRVSSSGFFAKILPKCTASLISKNYAITAAHCFLLTDQLTADDCKPGNLVIGKKGGSLSNFSVSCSVMPNGAIKMWIPDPNVELYILFNTTKAYRASIKEFHTDGFPAYVEFLIRHKYTKIGQGYGFKNYGGHDVLLLKLKAPITTVSPACLPGPNFPDVLKQTKLAGFGSYYRHSCQTGSTGPMKYHYCKTESSCLTNAFSSTNCKPSFSDNNGQNYSDCVTKEPSPAQYSRLCSKFVKYNDLGRYPEQVDEVHLISLSKDGTEGEFLETCYRSEPGKYGWCRTEGDYYDMNNPVMTGTKMTTDYGWGFCTNECAQEKATSDTGILRKVTDADVMNEDFCVKLMNQAIKGKEYTVKPEVICIGKNVSLNYRFYYTNEDPSAKKVTWTIADDDFVTKNLDLVTKIYSRNKIDPNAGTHGGGYYIYSIGSCHGDSGGPSFQDGKYKNVSRFVLTGLVSGGSERDVSIGSCGGINNPATYARMKKFVPWIKEVVDPSEEFCIIDGTK